MHNDSSAQKEKYSDSTMYLPAVFTIGALYTRADVKNILGLPRTQGGNWDTGYAEIFGQFFIFCNVGTVGRTGHDYANIWDDNYLIWKAKVGTRLGQPQIEKMLSQRMPVHVFHRSSNRDHFVYAGLGTPEFVENTSPVTVCWRFNVLHKKALSSEMLAAELTKEGFIIEPAKVKTQRAVLDNLVIYLKQDSNSYVLVIDPRREEGVGRLASISGVRRPVSRFFYHNSTMRSFPKRIAGGAQPIPFGIDFDFETLEALRAFVRQIRGDEIAFNNTSLDDTASISEDGLAAINPRTETEVTRAIRLGQQRFRIDLLDRWRGQCALTRLAMPEMLRASHIKPWRCCTDNERLDIDNGLLLAVHIDCLFDQGFISFNDDGCLLVSPKLSTHILKAFNLEGELFIKDLTDRNRSYLGQHRDVHFLHKA